MGKSNITFKVDGDFSKTGKYLGKMKDVLREKTLDHYGEMGVEALRLATPVDTGKTAESWTYRIEQNENYAKIIWTNTNMVPGWRNVSVAVLLQYGHGTGTGGYVIGRDYINPAMQPIFDHIADSLWRKVISL